MKHLVVLLRVHRRAQHLRCIFRCFARLAKLTKVSVYVLADRPTQAVTDELIAIQDIYKDLQIVVEPSPSRLVSGSGELYMTALKTHHNLGRRFNGSHYVVWDDDFWPDEKLMEELSDLCRKWPEELDVTYVRSRFLWNSSKKVNTKIPEHWQHFVWRDVPYCEFTPRMMVHCPERLIREGNTGHHEGTLINAGYQHEADRQSTFEAYKRAGKLDPFTFSLIAKPELEAL